MNDDDDDNDDEICLCNFVMFFRIYDNVKIKVLTFTRAQYLGIYPNRVLKTATLSKST